MENKECKYCEGGVALVDGKYLGLAIYYSENGNNNAYIRGYDKQGWDISEPFKINYCPNCGKKILKNNVNFKKKWFNKLKNIVK
ncbi:MAG: hypothetical protein KHZ90_09590 [Veillonella parvula]|uniref:Uncharacterized protein n=1 Tax=Veillonella parvula TaxID=29466 RepID=A0A942WT61_VEIPA|nr:hypothetical protein [Veillonella parvula]MBS4894007.1 hypothetical protein [Veillonella parvula]